MCVPIYLRVCTYLPACVYLSTYMCVTIYLRVCIYLPTCVYLSACVHLSTLRVCTYLPLKLPFPLQVKSRIINSDVQPFDVLVEDFNRDGVLEFLVTEFRNDLGIGHVSVYQFPEDFR